MLKNNQMDEFKQMINNIPEWQEGTMVLNKHNDGLSAPAHTDQANMGDIILIARGKIPNQNILYCVYENYPHQPYEIKSIDPNIRSQVMQNGKYFPKGGEVFTKISKDQFDTLNKNLFEYCGFILSLPTIQTNNQQKQQVQALPKYDFIYKSGTTNKIFKGILHSNRLAVLEPASKTEYQQYNQSLKNNKYAYLNMQNQKLVDTLLQNGCNRSLIGGKEYILSNQLMNEIKNKSVKDIVSYELDRCKNATQKNFK